MKKESKTTVKSEKSKRLKINKDWKDEVRTIKKKNEETRRI
jgi:hypothetical protein